MLHQVNYNKVKKKENKNGSLYFTGKFEWFYSGLARMVDGGPSERAHFLRGLTWNVTWLFLNISMTLLNKSIFVHLDFPYPVTVSMIHMCFTCLFSFLAIKIGKYPLKSLTWDNHQALIAFSFLFCANIMVGNIGINFTSVAMSQVIRASIPGITMVLSYFLLGKTYTYNHLLTITAIIFGVCLATYGDLEFTILGVVLQIVGCILSSCKSVSASKFLVGNLKFHPLELAMRMSFYAAIQMAFCSVFLGEYGSIQEDMEDYDISLFIILSINGLMAFLLNFSNFMFTRYTSPLTVTVSGSLKNVLTIIISIIIFHTPVRLLNGTGILITIVGAAMYNYISYRHKQRAQAKVLPF